MTSKEPTGEGLGREGERLLFPVVANNGPSGGRKFIYHVVDFLNEAGLTALVVHPRRDFRLTWFDNNTSVGYSRDLFPAQRRHPIRSAIKRRQSGFRTGDPPFGGAAPAKISLVDTDILVLPETRLTALQEYPEACRKIIFNQGPYLTFAQHFFHELSLSTRLLEQDILGMIVASNLNQHFQQYAFPALKIAPVKLFVEEAFEFQKEKKLQIAYMPRRGANDALAVLNLLKFRGLDSQIDIVAIDGMSQREVAATLKESLIFLSFAEREGFGLPAAEAMACGCLVIGYTGGGGDEFFDDSYCYPIREGNVVAFAGAVEDAILMYREKPEALFRMRKSASEVIRRQYSRVKSKESVIRAFRSLLENSERVPGWTSA